jgi:peptide chain release factor 2
MVIEKDQHQQLLEKAQSLLSATNPAEIASEIAKLEHTTQQPDFWSGDEAASTMQRMSQQKAKLEQLNQLESYLHDGLAYQELWFELQDSEDSALTEHWRQLKRSIRDVTLQQLLNGRYDAQHAVLSIHAGQGGTEAMDWADMVRRMYVRYCERQGWKLQFVDESAGEGAGIKSATYIVSHEYAYGYLKKESGTHRLVRLSPFNANNLRQTSFALVEVLPLLDEQDTDIELRDEDLEWKFSRSGGAGGQNVNKVNSAVELRHIPSGITVRCREERSQAQNKQRAVSILKGKLARQAEEASSAEIQQLKGTHTHASWGTQIRNYVLHPYQLVKDTRTEVETSDTQGVLDGDLDQFIEAELQMG